MKTPIIETNRLILRAIDENDVPFECNGGEIETVGKYYRFRKS